MPWPTQQCSWLRKGVAPLWGSESLGCGCLVEAAPGSCMGSPEALALPLMGNAVLSFLVWARVLPQSSSNAPKLLPQAGCWKRAKPHVVMGNKSLLPWASAGNRGECLGEQKVRVMGWQGPRDATLGRGPAWEAV